VDGYRFDLSKGFTQKNSYPDNVSLWGQYDASRITILENYTNIIHSVNPNGYAIMEHFADNSEEKVLAANNMLLWGNLNYSYIQAGGGWTSGSTSDLSWGSYQNRGWSQPNLVTYMESHDEERTMYKNISSGNSSKPPYNVKDTTTGLKRIELNANFFFTIPGPKMIWQFGELGYDFSINYPSMTSASRLDPKPIRWDYLSQWRRKYTRNVFSALINLKKSQPVFATTDYAIDVTSAIKRIWLRHATMDVTILGNFDVTSKNVTPKFTRKGTWYEYYSGDTLNVTDTLALLPFKAGEYRLYTTVKLPKPVFTGIEDNDDFLISANGRLLVYPNPSDGRFTLVIDAPSAIDQARVNIYNFRGELVYNTIIQDIKQGLNSSEINIDAHRQGTQVPGIYLLRVNGRGFETTVKVVVR